MFTHTTGSSQYFLFYHEPQIFKYMIGLLDPTKTAGSTNLSSWLWFLQGLVTLFSRITKLGWFDSEKEEFVFRAVITDVTKFLQVEMLNHVMTVKLSFDLMLGENHFYTFFMFREVPPIAWWVFTCSPSWLVRWTRCSFPFLGKLREKLNVLSQISEADASRSLTKHRKIASSFRDSQVKHFILNWNHIQYLRPSIYISMSRGKVFVENGFELKTLNWSQTYWIWNSWVGTVAF